MATSGTFAFNPSLGSLGLTAFQRIQVRPTELTQSHMRELQQASNLLLVEFANLQPNLWEVGLQSTALTQGTATYTLTDRTVMVLDLYISYGSPTTDRYLNPISRTEYASYPNKTLQGFPTVFWFNRLVSPTLTFWPVPDGNGPYTANYYTVRQTEDSYLLNGQNVELPYRWLEAFTSGLAWKLSEIYAPEKEDKMFGRYMRSWDIAAKQDTENVNMSIVPGIGGYFR